MALFRRGSIGEHVRGWITHLDGWVGFARRSGLVSRGKACPSYHLGSFRTQSSVRRDDEHQGGKAPIAARPASIMAAATWGGYGSSSHATGVTSTGRARPREARKASVSARESPPRARSRTVSTTRASASSAKVAARVAEGGVDPPPVGGQAGGDERRLAGAGGVEPGGQRLHPEVPPRPPRADVGGDAVTAQDVLETWRHGSYPIRYSRATWACVGPERSQHAFRSPSSWVRLAATLRRAWSPNRRHCGRRLVREPFRPSPNEASRAEP